MGLQSLWEIAFFPRSEARRWTSDIEDTIDVKKVPEKFFKNV